MQDVGGGLGDYSYACMFYGNDPNTALVSERKSQESQAAIFTNLFEICTSCVEILVKSNGDKSHAREALDRALALLSVLLIRVDRQAQPLNVPWEPSMWLGTILKSFASEVSLRS